jgi:CDP-glycerol glycerophosphotransferase
MPYMKKLAVRLLSRCTSFCISWASWIFPSTSLAVVCSPPFEGNGVETLRWLNREYRGHVVWLVDSVADIDIARCIASRHMAMSRVAIHQKRSLRAIVLVARAELVFFTGNFFGGLRPHGARFFVNLWHGDGPKTVARGLPWGGLVSNIVVAGTEEWGRKKTKAFGLSPDSLVVCGNPRIDQFLNPAPDDALRKLGIHSDQPIILWAPTFRTAKISSLGSTDLWIESSPAFVFSELPEATESLARISRQTGVQLVIKPHPLDCAVFDIPGIPTISDHDLGSAGITLYQFMARAKALITDYSSIWTDYIALSRPIGLYCPDLDQYAAGRGFELPSFDVGLPGPVMTEFSAVLQFIESVADGEDIGVAERQAAVRLLGIVTDTGATQRLMTEISRRFRLRDDRYLCETKASAR